MWEELVGDVVGVVDGQDVYVFVDVEDLVLVDLLDIGVGVVVVFVYGDFDVLGVCQVFFGSCVQQVVSDCVDDGCDVVVFVVVYCVVGDIVDVGIGDGIDWGFGVFDFDWV